ncbi:MAG: hypothetical protein DMD33_16530 [Gemmatimonadetes bacterium]|nr:MAG: hypothetical protein DMD33_16530 [Gemmatimonadota bacterium]
MSAATTVKTEVANVDPHVLARILEEGYGPGAWHGPDLKAALADGSAATAFRRPGPGRHNIAEIAMHHAWCVRSVANQLAGGEGEPFPLPGADWFALSSERDLAWSAIVTTLEREQRRLATVLSQIGSHQLRSPLGEAERFDLVLGITCHAVYHAGQIQLIKVLGA